MDHLGVVFIFSLGHDIVYLCIHILTTLALAVPEISLGARKFTRSSAIVETRATLCISWDIGLLLHD